mmetsp:Transcript_61163/g.189464  ORF Transcript_61163/g.189464 Transcript_61163/m.189464 type:complete len:177 (+) Transcript_61163:190-720(+)|eukprot:CAMPEP_0204532928 /NCGR_PEP_ID=MMETSP0661-20131031/11997_1 /ASSEMBLY_ACC=CAM_ASM_000606 /TAXON_ID=109239 /ORGANISM="Alexandrium margalefi, Strain AMGDE01CS-322" /LENGTH=176 /DNA_ID=CAMNT_0051539217 /DNA_START=188 /DNA_END=718 /DNA_ORIENTATION=+
MTATAASQQWFHQDFSSSQSTWIILCFVMLSMIGVCLACWLSDVYRLLPGWGPIRKFDCMGHEDMRIKQAMVHEHAAHLEAERIRKMREPEEHRTYGAIGAPTWGVVESPDKTETPIFHPVYGECKIREGFAETQRMREQTEWWAKDEPHFLAQKGLRPPPVRINGYYSEHSGRMA